jgi:hypothetical protein
METMDAYVRLIESIRTLGMDAYVWKTMVTKNNGVLIRVLIHAFNQYSMPLFIVNCARATRINQNPFLFGLFVYVFCFRTEHPFG